MCKKILRSIQALLQKLWGFFFAYCETPLGLWKFSTNQKISPRVQWRPHIQPGGGKCPPLEKYLLRMPPPGGARGGGKFCPPPGSWKYLKIGQIAKNLLWNGRNPRRKLGGQNFCPPLDIKIAPPWQKSCGRPCLRSHVWLRKAPEPVGQIVDCCSLFIGC